MARVSPTYIGGNGPFAFRLARRRPRARASLRNLLVFQQVAASMVLLLLTGFVVVGWQRSAGADVGFDTAQLYRLALDPVRDGYTPERAKDFFPALTDRLRSARGVRDVSVAQTLPLAMSSSGALLSAKVDFVAGAASLGACGPRRRRLFRDGRHPSAARPHLHRSR